MDGKMKVARGWCPQRGLILAAAGLCCQASWAAAGDLSQDHARQAAVVQHPNLFLNPSEIEQIRLKIDRHAWARALYARVRAQADRTLSGKLELMEQHAICYDGSDYLSLSSVWTTGRRTRDVGLVYAISSEPRYGDAVRLCLMHYAEAFQGKPVPLDSFTNGMGGIGLCWAYDLAYDRFSSAQRLAVEDMFRRWAHGAMNALKTSRTSNITFWGRAFCTVVGYTIGDRELVAFGIDAPGGLKDAIERKIDDQALWNEGNIYDMVYVSSAMAAIAEAALHGDGIDLYRWQSPRGNSIKGFYDACLRLCFPCDLRVTTYGDNSSQSALVSLAERNTGHHIGDYFLINDEDGRDWNKYDLAYRRYQDPAYAFAVSRNPRRDEWDHALWGCLALTHGDPLPADIETPAAPSSVLPRTGIAMLRSDESPAYWQSPVPAVSVRFGGRIGHGHHDLFHITLHGKGTLLEPDWFLQWDYCALRNGREGRNPTNWSRHTAAHNTVMADKQAYTVPSQSLTVAAQDFGPAAKVIRIRGSLLAGVTQERTLVLTRQYLLDLFDQRSDQPHVYDWLLHAFGRLQLPGLQVSPYDLGADLGFTIIDKTCPEEPANQWIREGGQAVPTGAWSAIWRQQDGRGVKLSMLPSAAAETTVYRGQTPYFISGRSFQDSFPGRDELGLPMVVARRRAGSTTFIALHEPFDQAAPPQLTIRSLGESEAALGVRIEGKAFADYFCWASDPRQGARLSSDEIACQATGGHGYVRVSMEGVEAQGDFRTLRVRPPSPTAKARMMVNGREVKCRRHGSYLEFVAARNQ